MERKRNRMPVLADKKESRTPKTGKTPVLNKFAFSFLYWKEIDYFGIKECDSRWYSSLLSKLTELSSYEVKDFLCNSSAREYWRYHDINWVQKNIPIRRDDLNWLPKDILENEDEFPIIQFQITQGTGRVIGFWDENNTIFHIVLLDPKHNMQPSRSHGYAVHKTYQSENQYVGLYGDLDSYLRRNLCSGQECGYKSALGALLSSHSLGHNTITHIVNEKTMIKADQLIEDNIANTYSDLFEVGIDSLHKDLYH